MPRSKAQGETGSKKPFQSYAQWAEEIAPLVHAVLAGEHEVPSQPPSTEAWLTYALYWGESPLFLEDVIIHADSVAHAIPNAAEIAWSLLRMRMRGWLSLQGNSYTLTANGRRAIELIVGKGDVRKQIERLEGWITGHPPRGKGDARLKLRGTD